MVQIIPTVLATSEEQYKRDIYRFATVEGLKGGWIHLDFMDNKFVPNQGIDPLITAKYEVPFIKEAHLMVQTPMDWIDKLVKANFKRVFFHIESSVDPLKCINYIKEKGLEVGIALNYDTKVEELELYNGKINGILMMSIMPGFQGQPFLDGIYNKIRNFKAKGWSVRIGVDGGVKNTNIKQLAEAGADYVICGSYLLNGDIEENLENLWVELTK